MAIIIGVVCIIVAVALAAIGVYSFIVHPTSAELSGVMEWLKYAVTIAEKQLGAGTGQLKLRYVYEMFVSKFPVIAKVIAFEKFSGWVDTALEWLNNQLSSNKATIEYVYGEEEDEKIDDSYTGTLTVEPKDETDDEVVDDPAESEHPEE